MIFSAAASLGKPFCKNAKKPSHSPRLIAGKWEGFGLQEPPCRKSQRGGIRICVVGFFEAALQELVLSYVVEGVVCPDFSAVFLDLYVVVELGDLCIPVEDTAGGTNGEAGALKQDIALNGDIVAFADDMCLVLSV